jgi:hypothetical protein
VGAGGQRVLSAIGNGMDDVVFKSAETRKSMLNGEGEGAERILSHALICEMTNTGRRADTSSPPPPVLAC